MPDTRMEYAQSDSINDIPGNTDRSPDAEIEDNEPAYDFPEMDSGHFTENLGQWEDHITYLAETSFGHVAMGDDGVYYYLAFGEEPFAIKITFQDARRSLPLGHGDCGFESNYFYGNDVTKWVRNARSFEEVLYKNVWPGIDILYHFADGNLKYDIIVGEYSDPKVISFYVEGHWGLNIEDSGLKILISEKVIISDTNLVAFYQDGTVVPIQFNKISENIYGFDVKKAEGRTLIIDPVVFSTSGFLGGSGSDYASDVAIDDSNNIIILGTTSSSDFPNTTGAYQTDGGDIVLTKMNKKATDLIFSTYLGDVRGDYPYGLEVDENNDIYVSGQTWSQDFPTTPGVLQESDPSGTYPDVFVLKLNAQGNNLLYSTYVGGTQSDYAYDIKVRNGNAYVVGSTLSYDFPYVGSPSMDPHGTVLFFILNSDGSNLLNSAFWGGWANEFGYSLAIDGNGSVVVGGVTNSLDFPTTPDAYQTTVNDTNNAFLLKYQPSTNSLIFSTYIGGDTWEYIRSIHINDGTGIYFAGPTGKPAEGAKSYPTTSGSFDKTINGNRDLFISKMDPSGSSLIYSTFIGGDGEEEAGRIDVDSQGNVFFTGTVDSGVNFTVTPDCYDSSHNGDDDAFVMILNNNGSDLIYSSFLGGNSSDSGNACLITEANEFLILGTTASYDFPVTNGSYQTENKGYSDIFITKFRIGDLIFLHEGWNLISVPLVPPDLNVDAVLSSIAGYYDAVQWYDAYAVTWQHTRLSKPSHMNTLENIDHSKGFWVHITEPGGVLFEYAGNPPGFTSSIPLYTGWNAVGYPASGNMRRDMALNGLAFGVQVDSIWYFDALNRTWREMGPSDYFVLGRGYWIHATQNCVWMVP
ncbi:MAG: SBBP repeat-containing protein [Thermoplasmata archaeon]|nr:MAG: SBBP repeat-containing protein [Thermoplasmata archaeon]